MSIRKRHMYRKPERPLRAHVLIRFS
jgi:hypothetical protein